ncbi:MAG: hypothetical protein WCT27_00635 [Patescibacteria group bacterium]|jgi:hypothetical protein
MKQYIPPPKRTLRKNVAPTILANQFLYHEFLKIFRDIKRHDFRRLLKKSINNFIKRDGLHHYWLLVSAIAEGWRVKSVYRLLTDPSYKWRLEVRNINNLTMTGFNPIQVDKIIHSCHRKFYDFAEYYHHHPTFFKKFMPNLQSRPERDHHPVFVFFDKHEHTLRLFDGMRRTTLAAIAGRKTIRAYVGYPVRHGKPMINLDKVQFLKHLATKAPRNKKMFDAFVSVGREMIKSSSNGREALLSTLKPWSDDFTKKFIHAVLKK